ncbi:hypothetical protein PsW64_04495 [Pseudovibrio sp. W64]|nr:hypothetical protein PsW64_04495 [Pseudovibrio sp. W64]KZK99599.1 hypothetical protein PsAD5_01437 [Pseudovibrio sp. Ad5]KZK99822.1 hypothetical protein PsW74_02426 [Pseudovibrio sp. W74]KZL04181.1 hypothetical protein PsAD14_05236 [Pseudovibrio sp. Ad14]
MVLEWSAIHTSRLLEEYTIKKMQIHKADEFSALKRLSVIDQSNVLLL